MYEEWGKEAVSSRRNGSCRSTETNEHAFALMVGWMRWVWIRRDGMGNGILARVFVAKRTNQGPIPTVPSLGRTVPTISTKAQGHSSAPPMDRLIQWLSPLGLASHFVGKHLNYYRITPNCGHAWRLYMMSYNRDIN